MAEVVTLSQAGVGAAGVVDAVDAAGAAGAAGVAIALGAAADGIN